jgi:chemotaxis methyl-accepting protein methylase
MVAKVLEYDTRALDMLLDKIYRASSHDFRRYRRGAIIRRLDRRLQATRTRTYLEYMQFLDTHPQEYQRLTDYLTIHISSFFRNAGTFQQVASLVLPELASEKVKRKQKSLSFWSTACASGEESYSIAIMLAESLGRRLRYFDVSIYATDISRYALEKAQVGKYKNVEGITDALLNDYFTPCDEGYRVRNELRRMVKFSYFNLLSTKTMLLTGVDCIFCCNILIYLQKQLQDRVLDQLYKSLAIPGYLVLGEAETPTDSLRDRLECLDGKAKIYRRKE